MMDLFSLKGKSALLTGGGRGIGHAMARGLRNAGATVHVLDFADLSEPLEGVSFTKVDITKSDEVEKAISEVETGGTSFDILVNNAGVTFSDESHVYPDEFWVRTLEVNLTSVFRLCRRIGAKLIAENRSGSIINVTSIGALQGFPANPAYGSAKGGVRQLTKALACEWGQYGIRVNCLAPGYTRTPMNTKSWNDQELRDQRANSTMLSRWAEPEEMVGPLVFLASDASSYMTGADLVVDGGWTSKGL